ncbi:hypothetical protein B4U80_12235 [Leptotrombidium deliense]|uniref:C2H2-type domain-containing protein n=1 Tax=Leptotrombidium deliense TaxID=299467 RepID=A0A443RX37_9ACAR|nr:hypothetical protein B4U80_12235 [Leptotrombidium deliense]
MFLTFDLKFMKIITKCFEVKDEAMKFFDLLFKWYNKHGKKKVFKHFPWRYITMEQYANYIRPLGVISDDKFISAFRKKRKVKNEAESKVNKYELLKPELEIRSNVGNDDDDVIILEEKTSNLHSQNEELDYDVIILDDNDKTSDNINPTTLTQCDENEQNCCEESEAHSFNTETEIYTSDAEDNTTISSSLENNKNTNNNVESSEKRNKNNSPIPTNRRQCAIKSTTPKNLASKSKSFEAMFRKAGSLRFNCPVCAKEYIRWSRLLRHIKLVHESPQIHTCNICGKQLSTKMILSRHMIGVHKITPPGK